MTVRRYLPLALVMCLWGSAFASSKLAVAAVPHSVAALLRFGAGALVLLLVLRVRSGRQEPLSRSDRLAIAGLGILGVFVYNMMFFWGLALAPSVDGSVVVPVLSPVITTAILAVAGRERLPAKRAAGLLVSLVGAGAFLVGAVGTSAMPHRLFGDLAFVASATCWAVYTIKGRAVLARVPPLRATAGAMVVGAVLLAVVAAPALPDVHWARLSAGFWLNQVYLVVLPTAVAQPLYYAGVRQVGPARAATMMFLVPVAGAACSLVLLGESVSPLQAVGSAGMLVGAWLTITGRGTGQRRSSRAQDPADSGAGRR